MIAALFVQTGGIYFDDPEIDPWDEPRDARLYRGDNAVVAHPPCSRWCRLAGLVQARWGHKIGDDDGCFASALESVRRCGGVLEHPAYSKAWDAFGLVKPPRTGGWVGAGNGEWTCHVEQGRYGHIAKKATWLLACGPAGWVPPPLRWGTTPDSEITHLVSWCGNHVSGTDKRPRVGKRLASATTPEFKQVLMDIAAGAKK